MTPVMPPGLIPLQPQPLDPDLVAPPLQRARAVLETPDGFCARDQRDLGVADEDIAVG